MKRTLKLLYIKAQWQPVSRVCLLKEGYRKGTCAPRFHSRLRAQDLVSLSVEYSSAQHQAVSCLLPIIADGVDEIHLAYE